jgi:hypothetical protein
LEILAMNAANFFSIVFQPLAAPGILSNGTSFHAGMERALTLFEVIVIVLLLIIFALGPEQRGRHFLRRVSSYGQRLNCSHAEVSG